MEFYGGWMDVWNSQDLGILCALAVIVLLGIALIGGTMFVCSKINDKF